MSVSHFSFSALQPISPTQIRVEVPDLIYESSQGCCIQNIENTCGKNTLNRNWTNSPYD